MNKLSKLVLMLSVLLGFKAVSPEETAAKWLKDNGQKVGSDVIEKEQTWTEIR